MSGSANYQLATYRSLPYLYGTAGHHVLGAVGSHTRRVGNGQVQGLGAMFNMAAMFGKDPGATVAAAARAAQAADARSSADWLAPSSGSRPVMGSPGGKAPVRLTFNSARLKEVANKMSFKPSVGTLTYGGVGLALGFFLGMLVFKKKTTPAKI